MPDPVADIQAYTARRAHLAVSALIKLFETQSIEAALNAAETEELDSLHEEIARLNELISATLQDRQRRRDNDFPEYLERLPF